MKRLFVVLGIVVMFVFSVSASNILAAPQCDFDYQNPICTSDLDLDCDSDAEDVTIFLNGFGRSRFNIPCPPNGPAPVAKTGQTSCYGTDGIERDCAGTGGDGEYQKGVVRPEPRFTDHGNGTITDNLTGLMWLKDANCLATSYPGFDNDGTQWDGAVTWQHALDFVTGINNGSYSVCGGNPPYGDWRLPNRFELESLLHLGFTNPAISNTIGTGHWTEEDPFLNLLSEWYWSSTTYTDNTIYAWRMTMHTGNVLYGLMTNSYFVWPVRGGH